MAATTRNRDAGRMGAAAMRRLNGALLLDLIRTSGPVSRADLSRSSGLTKPTVSSQVSDLQRRGLVIEAGEGEPDERGGKPSRLLRFDPGCGNVVGVEIASSKVRVRLADLDGAIQDREDVNIRPERGASHVLETLVETCKAVIGRVRGRKKKLMTMVVAAPGRVDVRSGTVLEAGNVFHWRDVAIGDCLRRQFRIPVEVENDVNLAALGEMHYGICRGVRNFALIRLTTGVGAGLVLDGKLFQGSHWAAGEIGHMVFGREAASGDLGDRGYLESAIGSDRLRARVRVARANHVVQAALSGSEGEPDSIGLEDPAASGIVEDLASHLGLAAADLVAVMDPELIVLAGELFDLVTDQIREVVQRVIPWPVRIERSALGDEGALLGAIGSARGIAHELICNTGSSESGAQRWEQLT
jgi:predicted NBD/HSP70 family sugar kinase